MKERYPAYNGREMHLLKYKWDGLLRAARKHNLWLLGQNGTRGGSGNGRSVIDTATPPKYFEEIQAGGHLEGPLAVTVNVLNCGATSTALSFGEEAMEMPDGEELEEHVGL